MKQLFVELCISIMQFISKHLDKVTHFFVCFAMFTILKYWLVDVSKQLQLLVSILIALVVLFVATLKEVFVHRRENSHATCKSFLGSNHCGDLIADVVGTLTAFILTM